MSDLRIQVLNERMIFMTRKNYSLIPVILSIIVLPQLFFWWLAPVSAEAHTAVLIGGTVLTTLLPMAFFVPYWFRGLRTTAGLAVASGILELSVIIVSVLLLALDSSTRSAAFAYSITGIISLIILTPMISSSLRRPRQGIYPANFTMNPDSWLQPSFVSKEGIVNNDQLIEPHAPVSPEPAPRGPKPLPPRNR